MLARYASFLCEFNTVKVVRIQDWRPRAFCMVFLLSTAMIGVWLVVLANHGYCEFHTLLPTEYKEWTWWDETNWEEIYSDKRTAPYCHNKDFDYYFDNDWQYLNNTCTWKVNKNEIMKDEKHNLRVLTSLGVKTHHGNQSRSAFIPHVEELDFTYHMNVIHKGRMEKTKFQLEVRDSKGVFHDQTHTLNTTFGPSLSFNVEELLSMMDVDLDEPNDIATDLNNKTLNITTEKQYLDLTASYRLTGISIIMSVETSNYKFQNSVFDDLEYITKVKIEGFHSVDTGDQDLDAWEYWNCDGYESIPSIVEELHDRESDTSKIPNRNDFYSCGISVEIVVLDGEICTVSFYAVFQSLLQLTVLFGIATFFVDNLFQFCSRTYRVAKITTDTAEWEEHYKNRSIIERIGREGFRRAIEEGISPSISEGGVATSPVFLTPDEIVEMESVLDEFRLPKMGVHDSNDSEATSPTPWKIEVHCSNDSRAKSWIFPLN